MSLRNDKTMKPDAAALAGALGESAALWLDIKGYLDKRFGDATEEWKFYGPKYGWTLKMIRKKRTLFYLTPGENFFRISFALGDKAVAALEKSRLPKKMIAELVGSKKYAEGRALRIEVRSPHDAALVKRVAEVKAEN